MATPLLFLNVLELCHQFPGFSYPKKFTEQITPLFWAKLGCFARIRTGWPKVFLDLCFTIRHTVGKLPRFRNLIQPGIAMHFTTRSPARFFRMISRPHIFCLLVFLVAAGNVSFWTATVSAENWPQWRGPKLNGISEETDLPVTWSETKNVAWRVPLPGPAGSTPVVWGDRIFLTSAEGKGTSLLCFKTEGKQLWKRKLGISNKKVRGDEGNSASPSPSTDGKHVWTFDGNGLLACFTFDGKEVWQFNAQDRYGKFNIAFGMTSTPILDGDYLYMQLIHGEGNPKTREAIVLCLNKSTGKEVWKHHRKSDARGECEHSYASPILYRDSEREFLVTHGADYVIGHSLKTGEELWRCGNLNPPATYNRAFRFVASPVAAEGLIVVPTAKRGPVVAIRVTASGNVTQSDKAIAWRMKRNTPDVPSPLIAGGLVYLCRENGNLICLDAKSGKEYYEKRTVRDRHRASPVYADGHVYLTARRGTITVVRAGKEFEIVATNDLGEPIAASPVISNGTIYIRTMKSLFAIRKEKP